jgi:hypothetical protein
MKWTIEQQQHIRQLELVAGPPAVRFAEWASETLWSRVQLAAIDMGLSTKEANDVAAIVCASTMRELRTAVRMSAALRPQGQ